MRGDQRDVERDRGDEGDGHPDGAAQRPVLRGEGVREQLQRDHAERPRHEDAQLVDRAAKVGAEDRRTEERRRHDHHRREHRGEQDGHPESERSLAHGLRP